MPDLQGEIPDKPWQKQIVSFAIHSKGRNVFIFRSIPESRIFVPISFKNQGALDRPSTAPALGLKGPYKGSNKLTSYNLTEEVPNF